MSASKGQVVGYMEVFDTDDCICLTCASNDPAATQGCEPIHAGDICDFDGKDPGCYECGGDIFPTANWPDESELAERRREYHDDIRADFKRLGLR